MELFEAGVSYIGACEKLNTHRPIIDIYNSITPLPRGYKVRYTDAWCMAFVSAMAKLAGSPKDFPYECSCPAAIELLMEKGLWIENDAYVPEKNDLIFYHWGEDMGWDCTGVPSHVGIVAFVKDSCMRILEGNFNDCVKYRDIPLNYKYVRGYGQTSKLWGHQKTDINTIAYQVIAGKWGDGQDRIDSLTKAGYDASAVQSEVNHIYESRNSVENDSELKTVALEVIRGEWGNNPSRKILLTNKGYDYDAVMEIVNNYYKGGKSL